MYHTICYGHLQDALSERIKIKNGVYGMNGEHIIIYLDVHKVFLEECKRKLVCLWGGYSI